MTGSAYNAIGQNVLPTGVPAAANVPPTAASAPASAHEMAKTPPTLTPWARAASWSSATARIASPARVYRKNANSRITSTAAAAIAAMWRCWTVTGPTCHTFRPQGSPTERTFKPRKAVATVRMMRSRPIVMIAIANTGRPTIGRMTERSIARPSTAMRIAARMSALQKPSHETSTRYVTSTTPANMKPGWAKLITRLDL